MKKKFRKVVKWKTDKQFYGRIGYFASSLFFFIFLAHAVYLTYVHTPKAFIVVPIMLVFSVLNWLWNNKRVVYWEEIK